MAAGRANLELEAVRVGHALSSLLIHKGKPVIDGIDPQEIILDRQIRMDGKQYITTASFRARVRTACSLSSESRNEMEFT